VISPLFVMYGESLIYRGAWKCLDRPWLAGDDWLASGSEDEPGPELEEPSAAADDAMAALEALMATSSEEEAES
jgi:hypothetical protein